MVARRTLGSAYCAVVGIALLTMVACPEATSTRVERQEAGADQKPGAAGNLTGPTIMYGGCLGTWEFMKVPGWPAPERLVGWVVPDACAAKGLIPLR